MFDKSEKIEACTMCFSVVYEVTKNNFIQS